MATSISTFTSTPAPIRLPDAFKASYLHFGLYPLNLVHKNTYPAVLETFSTRLDKLAPKLFRTGKCYVPFVEFTGVGPDAGLDVEEVKDDASLRSWLGDLSASTPAGNCATRRDPKCRFIFLNADSGRDPLNISLTMLRRILTYHQVMPNYVDFLSVFGAQTKARDLRFSGFRGQTFLAKPPGPLAIPSLGRSGRLLQLSYNLKAVACKPTSSTELSEQQWTIRQGSFYHQFDVEEGTALWIVTQGHLTIKDRIIDMTGMGGRPEDRAFATPEGCFGTTLTTHLLYCHWSIEEWRWYIQWLEEVIEMETDPAIYASRDANGDYVHTPEHIQIVQLREDKTNEAIMVLEANTDVLTSLRDFYKRIMDNDQFDLRVACKDQLTNFICQIEDMIYDSRMQIARAKLLVKITADRKALIQQHLQAQATEQMEDLTRLTIKIGTMAQREAIAMRIITVVTLIYLPATFVSTFFSTDIVKYQNPNNDSSTNTSSGAYTSFSNLALYRWFEVTLPLSALTLFIGYIAFQRSEKKADEEFGALQLPVYGNSSKSILPGVPVPRSKYGILGRWLSALKP